MKKMKLFLRKIIKAQFLLKHWFIFVLLPILLSILILINFIDNWVPKDFFSWLITIIWIIWWLLLNFLVILLTSNSTILTDLKKSEYYYWKINIWTKKHPEIDKISYYYLIYYRIFFLIFLSLLFIILYILSFMWISEIVLYLDKFLSYFSDIKYLWFLWYWIVKISTLLIFIYFIILYFILLSHLVYRLYYLFHDSSKIDWNDIE